MLRRAERMRQAQAILQPPYDTPWCFFDLAEIRVPVALWVGDRDTVCPPAISEALAERLPNATLKVVEGTHQLLFARWREILADVSSS